MQDEIIRLKRRLIEIESIIDVFDLQFEKQKIQKNIEEMSRIGRVLENESELDVNLLKSAVFALRQFIKQAEQSDEYKEEIK